MAAAAAQSPSGQLHARLLGLPAAQQQALIRTLSPGQRASLKAHILGVQAQLDGPAPPLPPPERPAPPAADRGAAPAPAATEGPEAARLRLLRRKKELLEKQAQERDLRASTSPPTPAPAAAPPPPVHAAVPPQADPSDGSDCGEDLGDLQLRYLANRRKLLELQCLRAQQVLERCQPADPVLSADQADSDGSSCGGAEEDEESDGGLFGALGAIRSLRARMDGARAEQAEAEAALDAMFAELEATSLSGGSDEAEAEGEAAVAASAWEAQLDAANARQEALEETESTEGSDDVGLPSSGGESETESDMSFGRLHQRVDELLSQQRWLGESLRFLERGVAAELEECGGAASRAPPSDVAGGPAAQRAVPAPLSPAGSAASPSSSCSGSRGGLGLELASLESEEQAEPALTPSRSQLTFRPRNARPLGALQPDSVCAKPEPHAKATVRAPTSWQRPCRDICSSGIDGAAVRDWLRGQVSGPLCLARLLDGLQWSRWSGERACKDLSFTEDLYGGRKNGYGGPLGGMAGGVARALAADTKALFGGTLTAAGGPAKALVDASTRLREAAGARAVAKGRDQLDGLSSQQVNLAFRRRCIETHPHRENGHLQDFLSAHLEHEIVRQWQVLDSDPPPRSDRLTDGELQAELVKGDREVREDAATATTAEFSEWDGKVSEHLLRLSGQKEALEAELFELRNHGAYAALGVSPEASDAELARAYKVQALRIHPDRGGSKEAFQALQAAYESILELRGGGGKREAKGDAAPQGGDTAPQGGAAATNGGQAAGKGAEEAGPAGGESAERALDEAKPAVGAAAGEDPEPEPDHEVEPASEAAPEAAAELAPEKAAAATPERGEDEQEAATAEAAPPAREAWTAAAGAEAGVEEEGLDDSGSGSDLDASEGRSGSSPLQMSEGALRTAVAAIPAEAIARQAELVLDGARVCTRVANLCGEASEVGAGCWRQIRTLAEQCLDIAEHVFSSTGAVGRQAAEVPQELLPVLGVVSQAGRKFKKAVAGQVLRGAKGLIAIVEDVSGLSREVLHRSALLGEGLLRMRETLQYSASRLFVSDTTCAATAALVKTVADLAGGCAEAISRAVLRVGDAQRTAHNFMDVLEAAGAWSTGMAGAEPEEEKQDAARRKEGSDDGSDGDRDEPEKEQSPADARVQRHRLLVGLNSEVLSLQRELRGVVAKSPSLLEAVSVGQKSELFALVAELIEGAKNAVGRAWRDSLGPAKPAAGAPVPLLAGMEEALGFVFAAGAWGQVAIPSLDARLLRLATLVDSQLLQRLLREDLFPHALALAGSDAFAPVLAARLESAAAALHAGCAGA